MKKEKVNSTGLSVLPVVLMVVCSSLMGNSATVRSPAGRARTSTRIEPAAGIEKIQHIVFIIKENRTFDNYFGTFPGADGATTGVISTGQVRPLGHLPDKTPRDIS